MAQRWGISNILLKKKIVTLDTIKKIQEYTIDHMTTEQNAIVSLNILSEKEITDIFSEVFHMETIDLDEINFEESVINLIPYEVCIKLTLIPICFIGESLLVAINDPTNITALETLKFYTDRELIYRLATSSAIVQAVQFMYSKRQSNSAAKELSDEYGIVSQEVGEVDSERDEPTIKLTNSIMTEAFMLHASDVHIEPYEKNMIVRYRIDGKLKEMMRLPIQAYAAVSTRIKMLGGMDISEKRMPQEGRINMNINKSTVDVRISTLPNTFGEKIVMRILEKSNLNQPKEKLGFSETALNKIQTILNSPHGIILVTGPTGSGKSTTLYSFINSLKSPEKAIVTVEDPVEYTMEGINQTPVNVKQGMTFPVALRSILRQDPDIIMIGEIRDEETASIAVRASITGHLVLSTLHTNDSIATLSRLEDMNIEPYLIADALRGVIAQRLMRRVCPYCAEEYLSSISEMKELDLAYPVPLMRAVGCRKCNNTGYKGRFGIYEILVINAAMKEMIEKNASTKTIREEAIRNGMVTLKADAIKAVLDQKTTISELRGLIYEV